MNTKKFHLDLQHQSFRVMLDGKSHLAPITNPKRVLDLATGTGNWAIEFCTSINFQSNIPFSRCPAQEYPEANVLGTDLSPIQPDLYATSCFPHSTIPNSTSSIPNNCRFEVDDAEDDWTFSEPFDYIHARAILACFQDNRAIAQKIFDNLAPGGYFELQDPSIPMKCDDETLEGTPLDQ